MPDRQSNGQELDLFEYAVPPAASMMEALRGLGYSVGAAIADLIDNSISAEARNVWLHFEWNGPDSWVSLVDDGRGMTEDELSRAMRPGSSNPLEERSKLDLGRFGLGLKTASLSQCRQLTVISKIAGGVGTRRWDLDYVLRCNEWRVMKSPGPRSEHGTRGLESLRTGTLVLWEKLDRIAGDAPVDDEKAQRAFHDLIERVGRHVSMVFHRYLSGRDPQLRVFLNGRTPAHLVQPWDPFSTDHRATITFPQENVGTSDRPVLVSGYVLPHKDRFADGAAHTRAAGINGWNAHQGFYVYRNDRLLVAGSWLDLGWTKEEHYKLARISVQIPNSMDGDWKIDVRKSTARPPRMVRERLRVLADRVRRQARDVFSHRGSYRPRVTAESLLTAWSSTVSGGRLSYRINRDHPIVATALGGGLREKADLERLLRMLEATVPVHQIWLDMAEQSDKQPSPFESMPTGQVLPLMQLLYNRLRLTLGMNREAAIAQLLRTEPFNNHPGLIDRIEEP